MWYSLFLLHKTNGVPRYCLMERWCFSVVCSHLLLCELIDQTYVVSFLFCSIGLHSSGSYCFDFRPGVEYVFRLMEPILLVFSSLLRCLFTPSCLPCPLLLLSPQSGLFLATVPQALSTGTVVLAYPWLVAWSWHPGAVACGRGMEASGVASWLFLLEVNLVCSVSGDPSLLSHTPGAPSIVEGNWDLWGWSCLNSRAQAYPEQ